MAANHSTERLVFEDVSGTAKQAGYVMRYNDFIRIPKNLGGHVSVFLWYPAYLTDKDGNRRREIVFRLAVTNHTYLSNFGGGFKANQNGIVDGLKAELNDEVPLWSNYIMEEIKKPNCLILGLRQRLVDHVKPVYKYGKKQEPIPIKVILFVPVSPEKLDKLGFKLTSEIRGILDKPLPEFHRIVDRRPGIGSDGIRVYHLFRKKMAMSPFLKQTLERHFNADLPAMVELNESRLTDDNIMVTLMNGKSRLRFSNIRYNNYNASNNEDKSWQKRKEYGKKVMSWTPGQPRIFPPIAYHMPLLASPVPVPVEEEEKKESLPLPLPLSQSRSRSRSRSRSTSVNKKRNNNNNSFKVVVGRLKGKLKKNTTRRNKK